MEGNQPIALGLWEWMNVQVRHRKILGVIYCTKEVHHAATSEGR